MWNWSDYLVQGEYTQLLMMFSHHMLNFPECTALQSSTHKMYLTREYMQSHINANVYTYSCTYLYIA